MAVRCVNSTCADKNGCSQSYLLDLPVCAILECNCLQRRSSGKIFKTTLYSELPRLTLTKFAYIIPSVCPCFVNPYKHPSMRKESLGPETTTQTLTPLLGYLSNFLCHSISFKTGKIKDGETSIWNISPISWHISPR